MEAPYTHTHSHKYEIADKFHCTEL